MNIENAVYPTRERVEALLADTSAEPVVMLNLLKFRDQAVYRDGYPTTLTGRAAYDLYAARMQRLVENKGGRFLFAGEIASMVIGEIENLWDTCALVEYPSAATFAKIASSPDFGEIGVHRTAGLEGQLLIRLAQRPL